MKLVTHLGANQVMVFGGNTHGFHGAGAAGYAWGGPGFVWRESPAFRTALNSPHGHPSRIGRWCVLGAPSGLQRGTEGMSFAIVTISRPGVKRSTPLSSIELQVAELCEFARSQPQLEFLMTAIGVGNAGYSPEEMRLCLNRALARAGGKPANIVIPVGLYEDTMRPPAGG